jgi:hypothetical protein
MPYPLRCTRFIQNFILGSGVLFMSASVGHAQRCAPGQCRGTVNFNQIQMVPKLNVQSKPAPSVVTRSPVAPTPTPQIFRTNPIINPSPTPPQQVIINPFPSTGLNPLANQRTNYFQPTPPQINNSTAGVVRSSNAPQINITTTSTPSAQNPYTGKIGGPNVTQPTGSQEIVPGNNGRIVSAPNPYASALSSQNQNNARVLETPSVAPRTSNPYEAVLSPPVSQQSSSNYSALHPTITASVIVPPTNNNAWATPSQGYCTDYARWMYQQTTGKTLLVTGNAANWYQSAESTGTKTVASTTNPAILASIPIGSIAVFRDPTGVNPAGHVAFVDSNSNGVFGLSEANNGAGFNPVTDKTDMYGKVSTAKVDYSQINNRTAHEQLVGFIFP